MIISIIKIKMNNKNTKLDTKLVIKIDTKIQMNIPILWIPCKKLISLINEDDLTKNLLINHYKKCNCCDFNNNNNKDLDFNKKLLFRKTDNLLEIKKITNNYQSSKDNIISEKKFKNYEYDLKKINLVYVQLEEVENYIYNNCIFILYVN